MLVLQAPSAEPHLKVCDVAAGHSIAVLLAVISASVLALGLISVLF